MTPESQTASDLVAMAAEDHRSSHWANSSDHEEQLAWRRLTARNGDMLDRIMDEHGWPSISRFGEEAARGAWLIAQHADRQLHVQRRALRLIEQAVKSGEAHARDAAFLRDRTLVNEGRKQVYGTQIAGMRDGRPTPWPCQEPEHVDELREDVGLEPFAVYTERYAAS